MELILIENVTKKNIGTINLKFIPRKKEIIEFENKTYVCKYVVHSEKGVHILVIKKLIDYEIIW